MNDVIGREAARAPRRRFPRLPYAILGRYALAALLCVAAVMLVTVLNLRFDSIYVLIGSTVGGVALMVTAVIVGLGGWDE